MKAWYEAIGLTPYRAAFIHLVLIGIPLRFGLYPTGWGRGWLIPETILQEPCTMFDAATTSSVSGECSIQEDFAVQDFGVRFILQYELAWVVWFVMRSSTFSLISFHEILLGASLGSLLFLTWLQNYFHPVSTTSWWQNYFYPQPSLHEFDSDFFTSMVFFHLLAIAVSLWTVLTHSRPPYQVMKWSIPANAIFCGAVINIFIAVASFEALLGKSGGVEQYYASKTVTPVVRLSFALAAFHTAIHAVLLLRIRTFLSLPQLRAVCLYKVIVNVVLPMFWFPERSTSIMQVDQRITLTLRATLILTYLCGYLFAGKAEGFSTILTSEKEE